MESYNVNSHTFYYVKLREGNNIRLAFRDGQTSRTLTPMDKNGVKISHVAWGSLRKDPRVELVRQIIEAGNDSIEVDSRIDKKLVASYEDQLEKERSRASDKDRIIQRLNQKIAQMNDDSQNVATLSARLLLLKRNKVELVRAATEPDVLRAVVKEVQSKLKQTDADKQCLTEARLKIAELENKIELLEEAPKDDVDKMIDALSTEEKEEVH